MRRADRLFQLVVLLRKRRAVTARELAHSLEVSERTVYRDVQDLVVSGVPIDGEAGVGYRLRKDFDLPPMMFTLEELMALRIGARLLKSWADRDLAKSADSALARIDAALPVSIRNAEHEIPVFAPDCFIPESVKQRVGDIRSAISARRRVRLEYRNAEEQITTRTVRPLGLFYWGKVWTVGAWCELRSEFRDFRLDRILSFRLAGEPFSDEPGRDLKAYFANL
jgi:predicted DNA-binding transcriptional regulator YafY